MPLGNPMCEEGARPYPQEVHVSSDRQDPLPQRQADVGVIELSTFSGDRKELAPQALRSRASRKTSWRRDTCVRPGLLVLVH